MKGLGRLIVPRTTMQISGGTSWELHEAVSRNRTEERRGRRGAGLIFERSLEKELGKGKVVKRLVSIQKSEKKPAPRKGGEREGRKRKGDD